MFTNLFFFLCLSRPFMFVYQTSFFLPRNPFCRCSTDSMLLYFATVKRTIIHTAIARVHAYTHTHKICIHTLHTDTHIQIHTYRYTHTDTHTIDTHAHTHTIDTHAHTGHTRITMRVHRCFVQRMSLEVLCPERLHSLASSPLAPQLLQLTLLQQGER